MALKAIAQRLRASPGGKVAIHGSQAALWTLLAYKVNTKASEHWTVAAISTEQMASTSWSWATSLFNSSPTAPEGEEIA